MSDLRELYQDVILDHYRRPRNNRPLADANRRAEGFNPLCGDRLKLYVRVKDGVIEEVSFEGSGCAISTASASLLTESIKGKTEREAEALVGTFRDLVTQDSAAQRAGLGKLEALAGVREFPARVKCATLAWHTLRAALAEERELVSTE
ncbi:MAG: SUF system NifU family Fe-S cluster assembly protein [Betaproteobacteria bacterium]|nr:MAG: SUF system NifU family Fe-S cluster assembly protein [Betaproteobacteria bacterium]